MYEMAQGLIRHVRFLADHVPLYWSLQCVVFLHPFPEPCNSQLVCCMVEYYIDCGYEFEIARYDFKLTFSFSCPLLFPLCYADDVAQSQSLIRPTLHTLLNLSWHIRGKYLLLASFAQHTDVVFILELCPTLPDDLLAVIKDLKLHSPVSLTPQWLVWVGGDCRDWEDCDVAGALWSDIGIMCNASSH